MWGLRRFWLSAFRRGFPCRFPMVSGLPSVPWGVVRPLLSCCLHWFGLLPWAFCICGNGSGAVGLLLPSADRATVAVCGLVALYLPRIGSFGALWYKYSFVGFSWLYGAICAPDAVGFIPSGLLRARGRAFGVYARVASYFAHTATFCPLW